MGFWLPLAIVSLNSARIRSRDSRKVSDLKTIQTALELYYDGENETHYPPTGNSMYNRWNIGDTPLVNALGEYIQGNNLPIDPLNTLGEWRHGYLSNGDSFMLTTYIEQSADALFLRSDIDGTIPNADSVIAVFSTEETGAHGSTDWNCADDTAPGPAYCIGYNSF